MFNGKSNCCVATGFFYILLLNQKVRFDSIKKDRGMRKTVSEFIQSCFAGYKYIVDYGERFLRDKIGRPPN